jgi:hypothetical protein
MLLPFLAKPFHMDDPLFLWSAEQIAREPVDFYGTTVNWYGVAQPLSVITKNPPLVPYSIAVVSRLAPPTERVLHAAFLLPAIAATVGTACLAARLAAPPTLAGLVVLTSPIFLTSATSVMCDVPMLSGFVWTLFFWLRGLQDRRTGSLFVAGGLVAVTALTKYFGMALLPLLALYAVWRERRAGLWCLALLPPVAVLAAYQAETQVLYGRGLLSDAFLYASAQHALLGDSAVHTALVALAFTGACAVTLLLLLPHMLPTGRWCLAALVATLALAALISRLGSLAGKPLALDGAPRWGLVAQVALYAALGIAALGVALADFVRRRDAEAALLLAWVAGTFVFAAFLNWTINARSVLPLLPALGIVIARRLDVLGAGALVRFASLAPAAALALTVAAADRGMAEDARRTAESLGAQYRAQPHNVWFEGHWGFQYYMQSYGFRPVDRARSELARGSVLARPTHNTNVFAVSEDALRRVETLENAPRLVTVMDPDAGAGFYSSLWGPLPYAFGGASADRTEVSELTQHLSLRLRR